jgi:hypothetical protein
MSAEKSFNNELSIDTNNSFYSWNLFNESRSYRFKDTKSPNLQFLSPDKNYRNTINLNLGSSNRDFLNKTNVGFFQNQTHELGKNLFNLYLGSIQNWTNEEILLKTTSSNLTYLDNHNPLYSNNPLWTNVSYDRTTKYSSGDTPDILRGKEEVAPSYMYNNYWNSYWKNINLGHSYSLISSNIKALEKSYIPLVQEYSEYDFRNWQSLEALEDSLWESTFSAFTHEDYVTSKLRFNESINFTKAQENYNTLCRSLNSKFKPKSLYAPLFKATNTNSVHALPIFTEDFFVSPSNVSLLNFNVFNNESLADSSDDAYTNVKNSLFLYAQGYQSNLLTPTNFIYPTAYSNVLNAFRADFDESIWDVDQEFNLINSNSTNSSKPMTISNNLKLRSTAKNSIVTYNAIQKVYKSRFDDSRSNANFNNFTNSFTAYPFITLEKSPYENILAKNKETFYNVNLYNKTFENNYSIFSQIKNSTNIIFADIPFLMSMKSDASRYLWFDWQSRWSSLEVQPSSIAKYSLAGLPYLSKTFEYSTQLGDELNDSENYLTKLARARKNYMPNWAYSPYFFMKVTNWFSGDYSQYFFSNYSTKETKATLNIVSAYWLNYDLLKSNKFLSSPTYSGLNTCNKITWSPINGVAAHYYTNSMLLDILSKREYLYRLFLKSKSNTIAIPKSLTVSPTNSLLKEIKASYAFIDPSTYSSEISRELLYQNTNFLKYTVIKDFLKLYNQFTVNLPINFTLLDNYLVHLIGVTENYSKTGTNYDIYKSQYRPMKKGVINMVRLQATSAIAMPTEIRLHVLASSKDVIHSWAIPSAGIKIDCVPGYSSHRVFIFLVNGIFWGQCMEICGRYHHWMPIVVYFMKRDLFFLWCTHFMHYSDIDNSFNMTDKQLADYLRLVSFDKSTW